MCTVLLPPGGYPIAVNKYIISYHIIGPHSACPLALQSPHILPTVHICVFTVIIRYTVLKWQHCGRKFVPKFDVELRYSTLHLYSRQWMVVSNQLRLPAVLTPEKEPCEPAEREAGWVSEPIWAPWRIHKSLAVAGDRTSVPRSFSP
jgi:hypothetical protein